MHDSTRQNQGKYTLLTFIQRGLELTSPKLFYKFKDKHMPERRGKCEILMLIDYYFSLLRYGATVTDYFEYEFWKKNNAGRKEYVTMLYSRKIQKIFNKGDKEIFLDKMRFNTAYARFRSIKSIDLSAESSTKKEFLKFVQGCNRKVLMKPVTGASGSGIFKADVSSDEKAIALYEKVKSSGGVEYLAEELFEQTGSLHDINPGCVNTVRIFTLNDGKHVYLMCAAVRIGSGSCVVDNIHSGGMVCELEKETGTIIGPGYNLIGQRYVRHPVTGKLIPGTVVPQWEKVLSTIKEAALMTPRLGHCAWDVAVSEHDVTLIEANDQGNFDAIQCCFQRGCKTDYLKVINGNTEGLMVL